MPFSAPEIKNCQSHQRFAGCVVTVFNDKDANNVGKLKGAINNLPGIESLKYQPEVNNEVVGDEIKKDLAWRKLVPTLLFLDPWG
jgi:hypothetical protein